MITHEDFDLDMTLTLTWPCYRNKMLTSNLNDTIGTLPFRLYENLMNISLQQILEDSIFNKCLTFLIISRHKILQHKPNSAEKTSGKCCLIHLRILISLYIKTILNVTNLLAKNSKQPVYKNSGKSLHCRVWSGFLDSSEYSGYNSGKLQWHSWITNASRRQRKGQQGNYSKQNKLNRV